METAYSFFVEIARLGPWTKYNYYASANIKKEDYTAAFQHLLELASFGDPKAQFNLAILLDQKGGEIFRATLGYGKMDANSVHAERLGHSLAFKHLSLIKE